MADPTEAAAKLVCPFSTDTELYIWFGFAGLVLIVVAGGIFNSPLAKRFELLLKNQPLMGWLSEASLHCAFYATVYAGYLGLASCGTGWRWTAIAIIMYVCTHMSLKFKLQEHKVSLHR